MQRLNSDESIAYGAAFISANYTAGIKTKKILVNDGPNYAVDLVLEFENSPSKNHHLFLKKANYGTKKKMNIPKLQENVKVTLQEKPGDYFI